MHIKENEAKITDNKVQELFNEQIWYVNAISKVHDSKKYHQKQFLKFMSNEETNTSKTTKYIVLQNAIEKQVHQRK